VPPGVELVTCADKVREAMPGLIRETKVSNWRGTDVFTGRIDQYYEIQQEQLDALKKLESVKVQGFEVSVKHRLLRKCNTCEETGHYEWEHEKVVAARKREEQARSG